jgi:hypothetical protein
MDTCDFLPGVKAAGREADYSPPSSAEVKNGIWLNGLVLN